MLIIGCDLHTRYQQIAMVDTATGEIVERRLEHENREARAFYQSLPPGAARVGIEATGHAQWFERILTELGHELWVGDAAQIRARVVRQQKTDARDAGHLLELLLTDRFPRIWIPSPAERDLRQLLWHRQKLVWMRVSVKNQLHALAMSQGLCRRKKLWSSVGRAELERVALGHWAGRRRQELLTMLDQLDVSIVDLNRAVLEEAQRRAEVLRLMTHPGVGAVVALAFLLVVGPVERFRRSKQVASYLGLNPREYSSGSGPQRLGSISKQGNSMVRWLLVEAAQTAARFDPELRRHYRHLKFRRATNVAKVAIARKLAVRLYWMLRTGADYAQLVRMLGSPRGCLVDASPSIF
jgi:transposase